MKNDCLFAATAISEHLKLWEKAMIRALRKGEIFQAQAAERQIERLCNMLCEIKKADANPDQE